MEYQKAINFLDYKQMNRLIVEQEISWKWMMNHKEHIMKVIKLNLKLQW